MKKERKFVLALVMDPTRSDVDFMGHPTEIDNLSHTVVKLNRKDRDEFMKHNNLTLAVTEDTQFDDVICHLCRGNTVYGQLWSSEKRQEIWMKTYADAY